MSPGSDHLMYRPAPDILAYPAFKSDLVIDAWYDRCSMFDSIWVTHPPYWSESLIQSIMSGREIPPSSLTFFCISGLFAADRTAW